MKLLKCILTENDCYKSKRTIKPEGTKKELPISMQLCYNTNTEVISASNRKELST